MYNLIDIFSRLLKANAAKEELFPYFPKIIEHITVHLQPTEDEAAMKLQMQAIGEDDPSNILFFLFPSPFSDNRI